MAGVSTNRPSDSAFKQQRLRAWQPILTPPAVIGSLGAVAVVFIAVGAAIMSASSGVVSIDVRYDELCKSYLEPPDRTLTNGTCIVPFELEDDDKWEDSEINAYYGLNSFHQNHRRYVASRSAHQLVGTSMSLDSDTRMASDPSSHGVTDCKYEMSNLDPSDDKEVYTYPCGLIAWSVFNDTLLIREKVSGQYVMWNDGNPNCGSHAGGVPCTTNPTGIAWESDLDKKFKSPSVGWIAANCKYLGGKNMATSGFIDPTIYDSSKMILRQATGNCGQHSCGMRVHKLDGTPNEGIYNCWHNTTDEDLVVWMRVAALPTFKKLYRRIPKGLLKKGTQYELLVQNRFPTASFGGTKSFHLSSGTFVGGRNDFLGYAYILVGALCAVFALVFLGKHLMSPRIMGDPRYLHWK
mmetsp:Transcript_20255/g.39342  ORF Transcript_20255/g.39342 Transcript_20255/m.39342 type:complete len:408 (+) Transcript_20255:81-1304(+)|eukprot:CAMPEP_0173382002 /NCGR_PEP_ID=MMETSP1356-20130122/4449_1 /TAXON_ID=77927 ORGANISM="Hemiselmis virescens, Strain PCC157" /NCGR_SAMPLE_ID=MMETSP1356 /ASSEMBLY_ACC=CAM_ASM_000847 /LENGTH=407 /DNA_ID=CAMNT_0014336113 /DNA_START=69 /DNA_END=1292 /DNA_ORIENTATION=-